MKRRDPHEVNDEFFDFSLSSPALKIRRLDAELAPIMEEEETVNPVVHGPSVPFEDNSVGQPVGRSPIEIDELSSGVPGNEERAIVLFNPMNNTPSLQSPSPFSFSVDSDFLSGFKNPILWSNQSNAPKSFVGETQKQDDDSRLSNGCLAVVPWVPSHSQHPPPPQMEVPGAQVSESTDADAMDVEYNDHTQQMPRNEYGATSVSEGLNQWQQHCMIPQPSNNLSTPITWFGTDA